MARFVLRIGDSTFPAAFTAGTPASDAVAAALPLEVTLLQEEWSGAVLKSTEQVISVERCVGESEPYQSPGRIYVEPESGCLVICYGAGRLQNGFGPLPAIAIAQVPGAVDRLAEVCRSVQFRGATTVRLESIETSTPEESAAPGGRRLRIALADAEAIAVLNEAEFPNTCAALLAMLPVSGFATNTHSSGPLVRFWNRNGGDEGETPVTMPPDEAAQHNAVLVPGGIYYLPKVGFRGFRIPFRHPTVMRSAVRGGGLDLHRVAHFVGDWSEFRFAASRLRSDGALPMEIAAAP